MKLLSCHIENFGKLNNKDYTFDKNLTVFSEENGAGKTTLAAFIRAMFYGMAAYKSNTKTFCDRQRYYPFGGGKFGGNLTFEKGGDIYRIERFFDKKSDIKDEVAVYKNNAPQKATENFGEGIFGLDADSFDRTAFITAEDIDGGSTSGIGEKITGRVFLSDGAGLEEALSALEKKRKTLKAARGNGGEIDRKKDERRTLSDEIAGLEDIDNALGENYRDRNRLAGEIAELDKSVEKLNEDKISAEKWAVYDGYVQEAKEKREELLCLSSRYPKGLPSAEEIKDAEDKCAIFTRNEGALENTKFLKEDRLKELERKFPAGVPGEEVLEKCGGLLDTSSKLSAEAGQISLADSKKAEKLDDVFRHGLPEEDGLEKVKAVAERYKANDLKLKTTAAIQPAQSKNSLPLIIVAAVSAVLAVVGVALLFISLIAGMVLLSVGAAGLMVSAILFIVKRNSVRPLPVDTSLVQTLTCDEQIIRGYLAPYGYYSDSVISSFTQFLSDVEEYKNLSAEREERKGLSDDKIKQAREAEKEVSSVLESYGYETENLRVSLDKMRGEVAEYQLLSSQRDTAEENALKLTKENNEIQESIVKLLQNYCLEFTGADGLRKISDDIINFSRLKKEAEEKELRAQKYRKENALSERVISQESDMTEVKSQLDEKRKALGLLDSRISDCEASLALLPEKRVKKEELEKEIERDTRTVKILSAAEELLKSAHGKLCDKYVAPVKESFLKYSDCIQKALGEKLVMTADFEVSFEFGGEIKSRRHLSAGQRAICGLCLRLALLENIYKSEKPFVIMDDPFINLDEENMQKTANAVKQFSGNVQIIYFCCHESRAI